MNKFLIEINYKMFVIYFKFTRIGISKYEFRIKKGNKTIKLIRPSQTADGGVSNIRSLIHLVILQSMYRHTHRHTDT